ncbi:hypothetical protein [Mesorhizobium sp. M0208]|uniref:hypothetical protein n=1 Tax=Mesorhizobium sp. M0208 TaxID=2956916 RepID=UPI0033378595
MKTGTPVDAAIIASAGEDDEEGDWVKHKGRPAFQCFKAHVGAYADTALVDEIAVTAPTPRTTRPFLMLCPTIPAKCLPTAPTEAIISATVGAKGGRPRIVATGTWGRDEAESSTPGPTDPQNL